MTYNLPRIAAGRKGLSLSGRRRYSSSASRWVGAFVAAALFGADTFQPVIGLVEVTQGTKTGRKSGRTASRDGTRIPERQQPMVVSLQSRQRQQACGELWPTFVFQPTINAGSGGSARPEAPGGGPAALPPVQLVWSLPAPFVLSRLPAPIDTMPMPRVASCRQIVPIGPPVA
jgi:hypothetical protein